MFADVPALSPSCTRRTGQAFSPLLCEREVDLLAALRKHFLLYWSGTPDQRRTENSLYRRARKSAAERELARVRRLRAASPGYDFVSRDV